MEAKPMIGVDDVLLGMTMDEVLTVLGEPDKKDKKIWVKDEKDEIWEYHNLGINVQFDEDHNFLLGSIDIFSQDVLLEGKNPIGKDEEKFLKMYSKVVLTDDFEENGKCYDYPKKEIMLWISDGIVENFTIFPEYDETGEIPIWPKKV